MAGENLLEGQPSAHTQRVLIKCLKYPSLDTVPLQTSKPVLHIFHFTYCQSKNVSCDKSEQQNCCKIYSLQAIQDSVNRLTTFKHARSRLLICTYSSCLKCCSKYSFYQQVSFTMFFPVNKGTLTAYALHAFVTYFRRRRCCFTTLKGLSHEIDFKNFDKN